LQLRAEFFHMTIDHLLVDLELATLWIELQESPSNLTFRESIVNLSIGVA